MAVIKQIFVWLAIAAVMVAIASVDWWVNLI